MNISSKIQCPTCGASSYKELEPSLLKCDYCTTTWEHQSIVAHKSVDNTIYDEIIKIYEKHINLSSNAPKYHDRILSAAHGMEALCNEITNENLKEELTEKTKELIEKEIALLKDKEMHINRDRQELLEHNNDDYILWNNLQYYYVLLASLISKQTEDKDELEKASEYLEKAEKVKGGSMDSYDKEFSARKVGLFQRLGKNENTYAYLYSLQYYDSIEKYKDENEISSEGMDEWEERGLNDFTKDLKEHQEQVAFDFEDILFSEEYLAWKTEYEKKTKKVEPKQAIEKEAKVKPEEKSEPGFFQRLFGK